MDARDLSSQEKETLAADVMDDVGVSNEATPETDESHDSGSEDASTGNSNDALYVQKRLKQQKRSHEREMREMHARMADMQSRLNPQSQTAPAMPSYGDQVQPGSVEEHIHKAVSFALNQRDQDERKAKEVQNQAFVQKQYNSLYKHLDSMGDKYDDFHDIVYGDDTKYTPAMRDYALTLPKSGAGSAGEVLYKLGKNPDELDRISKLHSLEQAAEMTRLSHALIVGGEPKSQSKETRMMGQIKSNPVGNNHAVNEKTPVSNIRQRMKAGKFK